MLNEGGGLIVTFILCLAKKYSLDKMVNQNTANLSAFTVSIDHKTDTMEYL